MNIRKKLQHPFALVAQGFVAGAILFFTTSAPQAEAGDRQGTAQRALTALGSNV